MDPRKIELHEIGNTGSETLCTSCMEALGADEAR